jgi:hypothetical protein
MTEAEACGILGEPRERNFLPMTADELRWDKIDGEFHGWLQKPGKRYYEKRGRRFRPRANPRAFSLITMERIGQATWVGPDCEIRAGFDENGQIVGVRFVSDPRWARITKPKSPSVLVWQGLRDRARGLGW